MPQNGKAANVDSGSFMGHVARVGESRANCTKSCKESNPETPRSEFPAPPLVACQFHAYFGSVLDLSREDGNARYTGSSCEICAINFG